MQSQAQQEGTQSRAEGRLLLRAESNATYCDLLKELDKAKVVD
jgi:hypothetical protein